MRTCKRCNKQKLEGEFRKRKPPKSGYYTICRSCQSELVIKARDKNPNFYSERYNKRVKRSPDYMKIRRIERYGITVDDYENLLVSQNYCCAICGTHVSKLPKRLHIDHDHETGVVRGLLCFKCNYGLGMFNDSINKIQSLIKYLKNHESLC